MNLLGNFRRFFTGTNFSRSVLRWIGTTDAIYLDLDGEKAITKGYNTNTAVFAIISKAAKKFAAVPQYVFDKKKKKVEKEDELFVLLNRPNDMQGQDAFKELLYSYRLLLGESFTWLNRGDNEGKDTTSKILEMFILPPSAIEIIPDPDDLWGCLGYHLLISGKKHFIPKENMIHWKGANLDFDGTTRAHMRGFSPLRAGYKTLQQNNDATDSAVRMYQHDGAKGVLHNKTFDKLSPEQASQIKGVIDTKINNNDVKSAVATLPGDWGYLNFGMSATDLALLEGQKFSWQELCALFNVPYEFFQAGTSYANKEMAAKDFINSHILPACKQWDDELNRTILKSFNLEGKVTIRSDVSELAEMQDDMEKKARGFALMDFVTPNEKREAFGYEPFPDPSYDQPWPKTGQLPLDQASADLGQPLTPEQEEEATKIYDSRRNGNKSYSHS